MQAMTTDTQNTDIAGEVGRLLDMCEFWNAPDDPWNYARWAGFGGGTDYSPEALLGVIAAQVKRVRTVQSVPPPTGRTDRERLDWQPINTAPRDGTLIIAYGTQSFDVGSPDEPFLDTVCWSGNRWQDGTIADQPKLTHWMPLTEPPEDEAP